MDATKRQLKETLGALPLTAELDWYIRRRGAPVRGFSLEKLDAALPQWRAEAAASNVRAEQSRKVLLFGMLRYWIDHTALLGMALAGLGHEVTLSYLPYADWRKPVSAYTLRQHNLYGRKVLRKAEPVMKAVSLLDVQPTADLPPALAEAIEQVSVRDVQYTEQVEDVDKNGALFKLRQERNTRAAQGAWDWMQIDRPDVVILPNGLILEFGAVYQTARALNIPVVSYEFGEQRERIWMTLNSEVMLQKTAAMWEARKDRPVAEAEMEKVRELVSARQDGTLWRNFDRRWQDLPVQGGESVRAQLGLDARPVVLLAANVIGDSLTLGRDVFSGTMTEWLKRTLAYFATRGDIQLLVRAHPGERNLQGGRSVADLAWELLPEMPSHIHLISADASVNTYDLVAIADIGLVYTTTVGLEMAMSGVPVFVIGQAHYREKGFTLDPSSWDEYFTQLNAALKNPQSVKLSPERHKRTWQYAYRFFFDFPQPFPWHLLHLWDDAADWPLSRVLTPEGMDAYRATFDHLVGEPVDWTQ